MSKLVILLSFISLSSNSLASDHITLRGAHPNHMMPAGHPGPFGPPPGGHSLSLSVLNLNADQVSNTLILKAEDDFRSYRIHRNKIKTLMTLFPALKPILSTFINEAEGVSDTSSGTANGISYAIEAETLTLGLSSIMVQVIGFYGTGLADHSDFNFAPLPEEDLLSAFKDALKIDAFFAIRLMLEKCPKFNDDLIDLCIEYIKDTVNLKFLSKLSEIQSYISQEKWIKILSVYLDFHLDKKISEMSIESLNALGLLFESFYRSAAPENPYHFSYFYLSLVHFKKSWSHQSQIGLREKIIELIRPLLVLISNEQLKTYQNDKKQIAKLQGSMKSLVIASKLGDSSAKRILAGLLSPVEKIQQGQSKQKKEEILQKMFCQKFIKEEDTEINVDSEFLNDIVVEVLMKFESYLKDDLSIKLVPKDKFFLHFPQLYKDFEASIRERSSVFDGVRSGDLNSLFAIYYAYASNEITLSDTQDAFQDFFDYHFDRQDSVYSLHVLAKFYESFGYLILGQINPTMEHLVYFHYQAALKGHRGSYNSLIECIAKILYAQGKTSYESLLAAEKLGHADAKDLLDQIRNGKGAKNKKERARLKRAEVQFASKFDSIEKIFELYFEITKIPSKRESFEKLDFKKYPFSIGSGSSLEKSSLIVDDPMDSPIKVQYTRPVLTSPVEAEKTVSTSHTEKKKNKKSRFFSKKTFVPSKEDISPTILTTPLPEEDLAKTHEIVEEEKKEEDDKGKGKEKKKRTLPAKINTILKLGQKVEAHTGSLTDYFKVINQLHKKYPGLNEELAFQLIVDREGKKRERHIKFETEGLSASELEKTIQEEFLAYDIAKEIERQTKTEIEESCTSPEEISYAPVISLREDQIELLKSLFQGNPPHLKIENKDVMNLIGYLGGDVRGKGGSYFVIRFKDKQIAKYESVHGKDGRHTLTSHYAKRVGNAIRKALELRHFTFDPETLKSLSGFL